MDRTFFLSNCELRGTVNVQGKSLEHILEAARKRKNVWIVRPDSPSEESKEKYSCIFLKPNKGYSVYYPQYIFADDLFLHRFTDGYVDVLICHIQELWAQVTL